jgi:hypothetical protein
MAASFTVRALLAHATARVDRLDAELLLAHSLAITRTHVMTDPDHLASPSQADQFGALIERRLACPPLRLPTWVPARELSRSPSHLSGRIGESQPPMYRETRWRSRARTPQRSMSAMSSSLRATGSSR